MILHCKNCKEKFSIIEKESYNEGKWESYIEGKIVQCRHCNEEWIYESKSKYLENRLAELGEDLDKTEIILNVKKNENKDKIINLENNLETKKEELNDQKKLEEKVLAFEKRLTDTEKVNSEQIDLEIGGERIDRQYGLWLDVWNELDDVNNKVMNATSSDDPV